MHLASNRHIGVFLNGPVLVFCSNLSQVGDNDLDGVDPRPIDMKCCAGSVGCRSNPGIVC